MIFTGKSLAHIDRLRRALGAADAVVIGAGAGLSAAAGFAYSGKRFEAHFADFIRQYGFSDMYTGGFYPLPHRKNTGHTGAATFGSTAIWTRQSRCIGSFCGWCRIRTIL